MGKNREKWSKFGVWQMPLFKFLRHGDWKENFKSTGRRDLNIKYTNFDQLKCWEYHAYECNSTNTYDAIMNARTTRMRWLGNKLISITGRKKLSITFIGVMTHIRKGNTVNYLYWGNDQHTKGNTVNYLHWGNDEHTKEEIPSITFTKVTTNIQKRKYRQLPSLG